MATFLPTWAFETNYPSDINYGLPGLASEFGLPATDVDRLTLCLESATLSERFRVNVKGHYADGYSGYRALVFGSTRRQYYRGWVWFAQNGGNTKLFYLTGQSTTTELGYNDKASADHDELSATAYFDGEAWIFLRKKRYDQWFKDTITIGKNTFKATGCMVSVKKFSNGSPCGTVIVQDGKSISPYWSRFLDLSLEMEASGGEISGGRLVYGLELLHNGKPIASWLGPHATITISQFQKNDIFEFRAIPGEAVYQPLFADLCKQTGRPLLADLNTKTLRPLYRAKVGNLISYAFLDKSHLWTRICDSNSNTASALPDDYFQGRNSQYEGSSGDSAKNIQCNLPLLYAHPAALANSDGTKSITLYFFCALCNWGCTADYERGDVNFSVLWKTFTVSNIPRATSNDPGPGNEPFAFSFTITIRKDGTRHIATAVAITDKDGNSH